MTLDFVHHTEGDWAALYVEDELIYQGHSIPTDTWLSIVLLPIKAVRRWDSNFTDGRAESHFSLFDEDDLERSL